jgi:hypothetical protein
MQALTIKASLLYSIEQLENIIATENYSADYQKYENNLLYHAAFSDFFDDFLTEKVYNLMIYADKKLDSATVERKIEQLSPIVIVYNLISKNELFSLTEPLFLWYRGNSVKRKWAADILSFYCYPGNNSILLDHYLFDTAMLSIEFMRFDKIYPFTLLNWWLDDDNKRKRQFSALLDCASNVRYIHEDEKNILKIISSDCIQVKENPFFHIFYTSMKDVIDVQKELTLDFLFDSRNKFETFGMSPKGYNFKDKRLFLYYK